jgi:hypothetical protein
MKKQVLHITSMFVTSMFLLATLALTAVHAQSKISIKVKVPFKFMVSDKAFPAGYYSVSSSGDHLTIQDAAGRSIFTGLATEVSGRHVAETGEVVFHCYGDRCFLSEFWTPTRDNGSQVLPSRYERELAKIGKGTEFAVLNQR